MVEQPICSKSFEILTRYELNNQQANFHLLLRLIIVVIVDSEWTLPWE